MPEVGRYNAGQKFVFWSMTLLIPVLFLTGLVIWEVYFFGLHLDRGRSASPLLDSQPGGDRGHHRLDHSCLCRDLGPGSVRAMTQGYVTPGWAWRHHRKWLRGLADRLRGARTAAGGSDFASQVGWTQAAHRILRHRVRRRRGSAERQGVDRRVRHGGRRAPDADHVARTPPRCSRRAAARLEALSDGHTMAGWLHFMAWRDPNAAQAAWGRLPGPVLGGGAASGRRACRHSPRTAHATRLARWPCNACMFGDADIGCHRRRWRPSPAQMQRDINGSARRRISRAAA